MSAEAFENLPEVDLRNDEEPNDVDKMPIEAGSTPKPFRHVSADSGENSGYKNSQADKYVRTMQPCDGEEETAKQVAVDREALFDQMGPLECFHAKETQAQQNSNQRPHDKPGPILFMEKYFGLVDGER